MKRSQEPTLHGLRSIPVEGEPPQPIPNGFGKHYMVKLDPDYELTLDAGVFDWLWRIVESKALHYYQNSWYHDEFPEIVDVSLRAVRAFRNAAANLEAKIQYIHSPDESAKKVLKRRNVGSDKGTARRSSS